MKVIRVLLYEGTPEWIENTFANNAVRMFSPQETSFGTITELETVVVSRDKTTTENPMSRSVENVKKET